MANDAAMADDAAMAEARPAKARAKAKAKPRRASETRRKHTEFILKKKQRSHTPDPPAWEPFELDQLGSSEQLALRSNGGKSFWSGVAATITALIGLAMAVANVYLLVQLDGVQKQLDSVEHSLVATLHNHTFAVDLGLISAELRSGEFATTKQLDATRASLQQAFEERIQGLGGQLDKRLLGNISVARAYTDHAINGLSAVLRGQLANKTEVDTQFQKTERQIQDLNTSAASSAYMLRVVEQQVGDLNSRVFGSPPVKPPGNASLEQELQAAKTELETTITNKIATAVKPLAKASDVDQKISSVDQKISSVATASAMRDESLSSNISSVQSNLTLQIQQLGGTLYKVQQQLEVDIDRVDKSVRLNISVVKLEIETAFQQLEHQLVGNASSVQSNLTRQILQLHIQLGIDRFKLEKDIDRVDKSVRLNISAVKLELATAFQQLDHQLGNASFSLQSDLDAVQDWIMMIQELAWQLAADVSSAQQELEEESRQIQGVVPSVLKLQQELDQQMKDLGTLGQEFEDYNRFLLSVVQEDVQPTLSMLKQDVDGQSQELAVLQQQSCVPEDFPSDYQVLTLEEALPRYHPEKVEAWIEPWNTTGWNPVFSNAAVVCSFDEQVYDRGNILHSGNPFPTYLSITGNRAAGKRGPRLWARWRVDGGHSLYLTALTIRNQTSNLSATPPHPEIWRDHHFNFSTGPQPWVCDFIDCNVKPYYGSAINVYGRLVAKSVSFLRLTNGMRGGAVYISAGGMAQFDDCLFDGNAQTGYDTGLFDKQTEQYVERDYDCISPDFGFMNGGGAIFFDSSPLHQGQPERSGGGLSLQITDSVFRNNFANCSGGAILYAEAPCPNCCCKCHERCQCGHDPECQAPQGAVAQNISITGTIFANNTAAMRLPNISYFGNDTNPCHDLPSGNNLLLVSKESDWIHPSVVHQKRPKTPNYTLPIASGSCPGRRCPNFNWDNYGSMHWDDEHDDTKPLYGDWGFTAGASGCVVNGRDVDPDLSYLNYALSTCVPSLCPRQVLFVLIAQHFLRTCVPLMVVCCRDPLPVVDHPHPGF